MIAENESTAVWRNLLTAEKLVLSLFGKILFEFPEKSWLETLAKEGVFEAIPFGEEQKDVQAGMELLTAWNKAHEGGLSEEAFEDIRDDYTRLFIGPGKVLAPPWESMYFTKERSIFREETLQVREWYRRFGLESVKLHHEPDDHIGLELAFVSHLAEQALTALDAGDEEQFNKLIAAQIDFMTGHTFQWAAGWAALVLEHTRTDFFKGVALIVKGVMVELHDILVEEE